MRKKDYSKAFKKVDTRGINKYKLLDLYLNRYPALLIVILLKNTSISPNILTLLSFFTGLIAASLYIKGDPILFKTASVFIFLSSILDCADGMLARVKEISNKYGAYLDVFLDRIVDFTILTAVSIGVFKQTKSITLLVLGLLGAGMYLLQINLFYLIKSYLNDKKTGDSGELRFLMFLLIFVFSLLNGLTYFIYIIFIETTIGVMYHFSTILRFGVKNGILFSTPLNNKHTKKPETCED